MLQNDSEIKECRKTISSHLKMLAKYAPAFIAEDDDSKKILKIGMDMINSIIIDLDNTSLPDSEILDIAQIEETWCDDESKLLNNQCDLKLQKIKSELIDLYSEDC